MIVKKYFKQLFFVVLIIIFSSCSQNNQIFKKNELPMAQEGTGFSLGLYKNDKEIEVKRTFLLQTESTFTRNIVFGSKMTKTNEFALLIFDHGKQIEFAIDGIKYKKYFFQIDPNQYVNAKVTLSDIDDGYHSINYILVRQPDLVVTDSKDIQVADSLAQIYNVRINLLKNISNIPQVEVPSTEYSEPSLIHGPFLNKEKNEMKFWLTETSTSSEMSYFLHFGNASKRKMDFYIVTLLNWTQIPVNEKNEFILSSLDNNKQAVIEAKIDHLKEKENILVSFMLPNPYTTLPDENPYTENVISSLRVQLKKK